MTESPTCDFHDDHDLATDTPCGNRCGAPATYRIGWLDGTGRYSFASLEHVNSIDRQAPAHHSESLDLFLSEITRGADA